MGEEKRYGRVGPLKGWTLVEVAGLDERQSGVARRVFGHIEQDLARDLLAAQQRIAELEQRIEVLAEAAEMSCETPPRGCRCPGCTLAREESERLHAEPAEKGTTP